MMPETFDPAAHLVTFHAAINALDFSTIERSFAEDAVYVSGGVGGRIEGRDAIMQAFRTYFDSYPDQIAEDTLVEAVAPRAARSVWQLSASHSQTGDRLLRRGEETLSFNEEGRIARVDVIDY